jgi:hypothetical protein
MPATIEMMRMTATCAAMAMMMATKLEMIIKEKIDDKNAGRKGSNGNHCGKKE